MPYKSSKIRLKGLQDRRRKLQDFQYDEIKHKYSTGCYSLQSLADEYKVSKKLVLLIVNPESKRKNDQRIKDNWRIYAPKTKQEHNETQKKTRRYKQKLYLEGKLTSDDEKEGIRHE